jgi:hypothetical protein
MVDERAWLVTFLVLLAGYGVLQLLGVSEPWAARVTGLWCLWVLKMNREDTL